VNNICFFVLVSLCRIDTITNCIAIFTLALSMDMSYCSVVLYVFSCAMCPHFAAVVEMF